MLLCLHKIVLHLTRAARNVSITYTLSRSTSINFNHRVMQIIFVRYCSVGTCVPCSHILKCNWIVSVALYPTFQSSWSYKYPSKHTNYVLIRFMWCVLEYQLPPTAITGGQSQYGSLLLVCPTSCGDGLVANEHAEKFICKVSKWQPE